MDDDQDTGTGQDGTDGEDWTPPTREEWEAAQADHQSTVDKLKAASAESAQRKKKLADLERQHETDAERTSREAQEAAAAGMRPKLLALTGTVAAAFSGARPERLAALLRLVDFDQVDLDTGGGLDGEADRLRAEYPEFFRADGEGDQGGQQRPAGAGRAEVGARKPAVQALGPLEQLAAQIQGRR